MVVIEPEPVSEENSRVNVTPETKSKRSSATMATPVAAEASSSHNATLDEAYGSDGFETASDSEFNGGEGDNDGSLEATVNDDELRQKALAEANDAKSQGNRLFGAGQYEEALLQYEAALQVAPDIPDSNEIRSICHANRAICLLKLGKYADTITECSKALELNPNYVKALLRRAEAHEKLEHFEEAIADMKKVLEMDPSNVQARKTVHRLEPLAAEKREKMKQEMIDKLKEMGNSILGRFGMSVDNFKAVKDPNTGSYSVSFQR